MPTIRITGDAASDSLLSSSPLALLIGMALDQQIPMEKAFRGPQVLQERLGQPLSATAIAARADLAELFATPPAIHRFPGSMAGRVQQLAQYLVDQHGGSAENLWDGVKTGPELLARLTALPGFGDHKARIFLALLGKQYRVRPRGWREAAGAYGEEGVRRSVADVTGPDSLLEVRSYKQAQKQAAKQAAAAPA
ncbi:MAG: Fe-S cluster assembly protein HesB [Actinomycetota bacterium]|nr:Fe-S cluster assembly protein HesB [Actinomycetota bacterium]